MKRKLEISCPSYMRCAFLLFLCTGPLMAQQFRFGIRGGVPFNDSIETNPGPSIQFSNIGKRLAIGPTVEYWHDERFGASVDLLYRHISFDTTRSMTNGTLLTATTKGNSWEFPVQAKMALFGNRWDAVKPVVGAGISFRAYSNVKETRQTFVDGSPATIEIEDPPSLVNGWTPGLVFSAGAELGNNFERRWRLVPEFRYTVWFRNQFDSPNGFNSAQNQFELVVGFVF